MTAKPAPHCCADSANLRLYAAEAPHGVAVVCCKCGKARAATHYEAQTLANGVRE